MLEKKDTVTIYLMRSRTENKVYIGKTKASLVVRRRQHRWKADKDQKRGTINPLSLQAAILKYGIVDFTIEPLAEVSPEEAFEKEKYYIELYKATDPEFGYNINDMSGNFSFEKEEQRVQKLKEAHSRIKELHRQRQLERYKDPEKRKQLSESIKKLYDQFPHYLEESARKGGLKAKELGVTDPQRSSYRVTFKDGRVEEFVGLSKWCKENGYSASIISRMADGLRKSHKDIIKVERISFNNSAVRAKAKYRLVKENGKEIIVEDLGEFCKENGYNQDTLMRVGKYQTVNGVRRLLKSVYGFVSLERIG